jgi:hypothetical protein
VQLGKAAMEDTMGQAASLTGGYGSSYAQNVGHQAYDAHLQNLNDVIPELYQMAYDQYQDQGKELLQSYSILADEEGKAYDRQAQAQRDAVSDYQWQKNFDYQAQRDGVSDAQWQKTFDYQAQQDAIANAIAQAKLNQQPQSNMDQTDYSSNPNGSVSKGNVKIMQRILGLPEDGYWGYAAYKAAGNRTADQAWEEYQKGSLQYRYTPYKTPAVAGVDNDYLSVDPHTDRTRDFVRRMRSPASFGGSPEAYKSYITKELSKEEGLTDDELRTLFAHYGILRYYNLPNGW